MSRVLGDRCFFSSLATGYGVDCSHAKKYLPHTARQLDMTTPTVERWTPPPADEQAFRTTDDTLDWLCHLPADVAKEYAGKWVAARGRQIIASGDSLDALLAEVGDADLQTLIIDRIEKPAWVVY